MGTRRRFKQTTSLAERLRMMLSDLRSRCDGAQPEEQAKLKEKIRSAEEALRIHGWLESGELKPPK